MDRQTPETDVTRQGSVVPRIQIIYLFMVLLGYPILSVLMGTLGRTEPSEVTSKITQVYLPTLLVQVILIVSLWWVLFAGRTRFGEIGLAREDVNWSNLLSAGIFFLGAWGLMVIIKGSIMRSGYVAETDYYLLMPSKGTEAALWAILSAGAALSEELIFRGFVITRLKAVSGRLWPGAVLGSLAFSMGHLYQGAAGVILTFLYGMLFAGLFAARRSVFPCIVAHFLQDAVILAALIAGPQ